MKLIKLITGIGALLGLGIAVFLFIFAQSPLMSGSSKTVEFDLVKGMRPYEIATALENLGLVQNRHAFYWLGKITHGWSGLKAADYELSTQLSPLDILKVLRSGIGIQHPLLVKEGDNIYQVANSIEATGLATHAEVVKLLKNRELIQQFGLSAELATPSLEGYLFPNTYFYNKHDSAVSLIKKMVDAFLKSWTPENEARAQELGLSRYQVITLASIIEKETGADFERPLISSVFHNRLRTRMRLQSDPTTIYGMWDRYDGNIHKQDLLTPSAYNTYTLPALPLGPISNPNPASVKAALFPAQSEFFYFVSNNDGTHRFSKTYDEHRRSVKTTQLDPKAREGKSWRNLNQHKTVEH